MQPYSSDEIKYVASVTEMPAGFVSLVADAAKMPIRSLAIEAQALHVAAEIAIVGADYGALNIPKNILTECARLMQDKFAHLGLSEIREAYRQFAMGELNLGKEAETYRGEFNARSFAAIMAAYAERRKVIYSKLSAIEHDKAEETRKAAKEARQKAQFRQDFEKSVNELIRANGVTWRDVPGWWYDTFVRWGVLNVPAQEKREIFEQARQLAAAELYERRQNAGVIEAAALQKAIEAIMTATDQTPAQNIAKKICAFDYIIADYALSGEVFRLPANPKDEIPF